MVYHLIVAASRKKKKHCWQMKALDSVNYKVAHDKKLPSDSPPPPSFAADCHRALALQIQVNGNLNESFGIRCNQP